MERWGHWWNGEYDRRHRCDVLLFCDAGAWWIEVRQGGVQGHHYWHEYADVDAATDRVRELMAGTCDWQQIS